VSAINYISFLKTFASSRLCGKKNRKAKMQRQREIFEVDFLTHNLFRKTFASLRLCGEKSAKTISL